MRKLFDVYPIRGDINITREQLLNHCFCFTLEPSTTYDISVMLDMLEPYIRGKWGFYVYERSTGYLDYFKTIESLKTGLLNSFIYKL